ncbi:YfbU family protein [Morganella morganii]|nr:YfbU family protein [Morganella morganii]HCR3195069.1 YfbU family protein [Morganella morganii]
MSYSQADKLQLLMMCDIYRALGIGNSFNPDVIEEAISTDNYWAIGWNNEALNDGNELPEKVRFVIDTIEMYSLLDYTYSNMSDDDKKLVSTEVQFFSSEHSTTFPGFDGNNEHKYIQIARLLKMLGAFEDSDITKNSHHPSIETYQRMLDVFLSVRGKFIHGTGIPTSDFIQIYLARIHPSNR